MLSEITGTAILKRGRRRSEAMAEVEEDDQCRHYCPHGKPQSPGQLHVHPGHISNCRMPRYHRRKYCWSYDGLRGHAGSGAFDTCSAVRNFRPQETVSYLLFHLLIATDTYGIEPKLSDSHCLQSLRRVFWQYVSHLTTLQYTVKHRDPFTDLLLLIGVGISNGGGTISDMFKPEERAGIFGWYLLGPLLGPTLGPLFGGMIVQYLDWRWYVDTRILSHMLVEIADIVGQGLLGPDNRLHDQHSSRLPLSPGDIYSRHPRQPLHQGIQGTWHRIHVSRARQPFSHYKTPVEHATAPPHPLHPTYRLHNGDLPSNHLRKHVHPLHKHGTNVQEETIQLRHCSDRSAIFVPRSGVPLRGPGYCPAH